MIFTEKFEFGKFGTELKNSYIVVKLFNKQESYDYIKNMNEFDKGLGAETNDDVLISASKAIEFAYLTVQNQFVEGKFFDKELNGEKNITKEEIMLIPPKVIGEIVSVIRGDIQKKN